MTDQVIDAEVVDDDGKRSRRQLLTLAGAAAVGGTALALGQASPAGADDGDPVLQGQTNTYSLTTTLECDTALTALAVVSAGPGIRAQGTGAPDIKATGTGRIAQIAAATNNAEPSHGIVDLDIGGGVVPAHEIVRSNSGVIWASTGTAVSGSTTWKRINAVRLDNPSGNGSAFAPFRLIDSRPTLNGAIVRNTKFASNTTVSLDVDGTSQIPDGAIGIFGNVTVLNANFTGFVTLYPGGTSAPVVANVNFSPGSISGNFFQVGLSPTNGTLNVRPGDAPGGSCDIIIDVFGYIQ